MSKVKEGEIVKREMEISTNDERNSVESFISQAIEKNVSIEVLEKIFALREKIKLEQAKSAFVQALANFQKECPVIVKTKKVLNKDGINVRYLYAPIDSIVEQIKKPLATNGISYTWNVKNDPGLVTAIITVTHILGHSQTSELQIPIDKEGYMSAPQKVASAMTFAKRQTLCNALGISTGDEDTDATDVGKEKTPKSIKSKIIFNLRQLGVADTKEKLVVQKAVKSLTSLDLKEENFEEINGRLEILVQEKNEDKEIQ